MGVNRNTPKDDDALSREFPILNQYGIHARPAALFVKVASRCDGDVQVEKDGTAVSGKSIMGLMTLAAEKGSRIGIKIDGPDAKEAMQELERIISGEDR